LRVGDERHGKKACGVGDGAANDSAADDLLAQIEREAQETCPITGIQAFAVRVMAALRKVPRRCFVPDELEDAAYRNHPLPIGYGQTISQPFIVALMTELIEARADDRVLEVGTGSGYQTAILAELVARVYSLEIVDELAETARRRLQRLGYDNVDIRSGNGPLGWPEHASYDAILITAAAPLIPPRLLAQLKPGRPLVMPVGRRFSAQELVRASVDETGQTVVRRVLPVIFVPLTGAPGD